MESCPWSFVPTFARLRLPSTSTNWQFVHRIGFLSIPTHNLRFRSCDIKHSLMFARVVQHSWPRDAPSSATPNLNLTRTWPMPSHRDVFRALVLHLSTFLHVATLSAIRNAIPVARKSRTIHAWCHPCPCFLSHQWERRRPHPVRMPYPYVGYVEGRFDANRMSRTNPIVDVFGRACKHVGVR